MPGAVWIGPTVNEGDGDGRPGEPADAISTVVGVVLHIQQGTEAGSEAWQRNPAARVSSHFLVPKSGGIRQMVDTADRAWCQVAGNRHWLSIELEGRSGDTMTPGQLDACAQVLAWAHRVYGVPIAVSNAWAATDVHQGGLGYHAMGGNAWGGHFDCPGTPIIHQRDDVVSRALQLQEDTVGLTPEQAQQLADVHFAITQIPDPATPGAPRSPLQVIEYKVLGLEESTTQALTDIRAQLQQILARLPQPPAGP